FAVLRNADRGAVYGTTDGADLVPVFHVHGCGSGGFGEAVPLQHGNPDTVEEVGEASAERCPAGHRGNAPSTEGGAQLAVDELVEHGVLDAQSDPDLAGLAGLAVLDGCRFREVEDASLALTVCLLLRGVVHLFE